MKKEMFDFLEKIRSRTTRFTTKDSKLAPKSPKFARIVFKSVFILENQKL